MKNKIIKIDRFILDRLTIFVKRWMAKHDYEKHKFDFLIELEKFNYKMLFLFAFALPVTIFFLERQFFAALFHGLIWGILGGSGYIFNQRNNQSSKQYYDQVYSLRKEPAFTSIYKEVLENLFIESYDRRLKLNTFILCTLLFYVIWMLVLLKLDNFINPNILVVIYLIFNYFVITIRSYIFYVFDMDEPTQKEEAKESITDIVRREWEQLIGGLSPAPTFCIFTNPLSKCASLLERYWGLPNFGI